MSPILLPAAESAPLRWRRSFPGGPEQARVVRRFVGCLLAGCPFLDDVLFVADELVVNAMRHTKSGRGGSFVVEVFQVGEQLAVSVTDQAAPGEPVAVDIGLTLAESGRGLRTVSLTAASWGWYGNDQDRTVIAVFTGRWPGEARSRPRPDAPSGPPAHARDRDPRDDRRRPRH